MKVVFDRQGVDRTLPFEAAETTLRTRTCFSRVSIKKRDMGGAGRMSHPLPSETTTSPLAFFGKIHRGWYPKCERQVDGSLSMVRSNAIAQAIAPTSVFISPNRHQAEALCPISEREKLRPAEGDPTTGLDERRTCAQGAREDNVISVRDTPKG